MVIDVSYMFLLWLYVSNKGDYSYKDAASLASLRAITRNRTAVTNNGNAIPHSLKN